MAAQTGGRSGKGTAGGRDTAPVTTATGAVRPTVPTDDAPRTAATEDDRRPTVTPSPRNGVLVNHETVRTAFLTGDASQSVGYVQHVLRSRGFEPGNVAGVGDQATRTAYARFQESIGERPTGLPTPTSLDVLGFDVFDG